MFKKKKIRCLRFKFNGTSPAISLSPFPVDSPGARIRVGPAGRHQEQGTGTPPPPPCLLQTLSPNPRRKTWVYFTICLDEKPTSGFWGAAHETPKLVLGVSGWIPRKEHEKPRDCSSPMPSCPQNTGPQRPPLPGWAFLTGMEVWTPICPRCPAPAPDQDRRRPLGEGQESPHTSFLKSFEARRTRLLSQTSQPHVLLRTHRVDT